MSGDSRFQFGEVEARCARSLIAMAIEEDFGRDGDLTSTLTVPLRAEGTAQFVARTPGVLAGLPVVELFARELQLGGHWQPHRADGDTLDRGTLIAEIAGPVRSILCFERIALNFLQRLSGVASLTARFVQAVSGTSAEIYDTRKTTPGWRPLEKYAVRCGGGRNHRMGLYDAILIKDNHLAFLQGETSQDPITAAIMAARAGVPRSTIVEVEVDSLDQFDVALGCRPDIILLDNLGAESLQEAVSRRDAIARDVKLEASGGITLEKARSLALAGVDRISVGALTHSAPALDIGLDVDVRVS